MVVVDVDVMGLWQVKYASFLCVPKYTFKFAIEFF